MLNGYGSNDGGAMQYAIAAKRTQIGADWFFWIAGFSLINSVLALFGAHLHFVIGLGTTEMIDVAMGKGIALALDIVAAAFYVLYGFFARKGEKWAFLTGMVFYILDGILLLVFQDWLSVAFHAYALFRIFQGFQAAQQLGVLRAEQGRLASLGSLPPSSTPPSGDVWPPPPSL